MCLTVCSGFPPVGCAVLAHPPMLQPIPVTQARPEAANAWSPGWASARGACRARLEGLPGAADALGN